MNIRKLFREKVSLEKRKKLKRVLRYKGDITYEHNMKPYVKGFLDGQKINIKKNYILIESLHGKEISGHLFALVRYLNKLDSFKVFIVSKDPSKSEELLNSYGLKNVKVIKHLSYKYGLYLSTSRILINDNTFYPFFSKREGQKYYNLWHGTPLKTLGKDIEGEFLDFGNVTRNFMMCDSLYLSNEYTAKKLLESLDLDGVLKTSTYIGPSPRNSLLFDKVRGQKIREDLDLKDKKVYIYMPTWRGNKKDKDINFKEENILTSLEQRLPDNVVVFYKLHSMITNSFKFQGEKVRPFPSLYDTYDFMSAVDGLITDYSSIMYDFASQGKKIILFNYDYLEYSSSRGMYQNIYDYPFYVTDNIKGIVDCIENDEEVDYSEFSHEFCSRDSIDGTQEIINHMLFEKNSRNITVFENYNGKPNVYMFIGPMWDTGITTALKNLLKNIDINKRNYILCFERKAINKIGEENIKSLPKGVKIYPIEGIRILTPEEKKIHKKYETEGNSTGFSSKLKFIQNREIARIFGNNIPEYYIHYTGFESKYSEFAIFLKNFGTKTMIYVHTDMFEDYKNKKNYNKNLVSDAWQHADNLVLVNKHLQRGFEDNFSYTFENISVANNFLGIDRINELLNEEFLDTFLQVRFHYRSHQSVKSDLFETLYASFIDEETSDDMFIRDAISLFEKNPIIKYAKNANQKRILLENKYFKQELQLAYLKVIYEDRIIEDFSKVVKEKEEYIDLMIKLLREEINTSYYLRHYVYLENYIHSYYRSLDFDNDTNDGYNLDAGLEIFKSNFGLRKMEVLKELEDPKIKVFFNIGRFDQQKGHDRLIRAFEKIYERDSNTRLYILASYGPVKDKILNQIKNSDAKEAITVFDRMSNPYLLLSKVDAFVLSSYYEGLGLVVYESMYVNTPVISVDLDTTTQFLKKSDIILVEDSEEGLVEGMQKLINNELPTTKFDFVNYEKNRVEEFEKLF